MATLVIVGNEPVLFARRANQIFNYTLRELHWLPS
jgi:hypothetical protein